MTMSDQQNAKIQELSDRNRTLVDKVSILERENRSLREKYRDALERLDEAEADMIRLVERNASLAQQLLQKDEELYAYGKLDPRSVPSEDDRHG